MTTDQKHHWNSLHREGAADHDQAPLEGTRFAQEVQSFIEPNSTILEIGCGTGNDARYFASKEHTVLATDFAEAAIEKNKAHISRTTPNNSEQLRFEVLDISEPTRFANSIFAVVYARLSLHYFTDSVTKQIFKELQRILKPGGYLCFICKSVNDPLYGKGKKIEKDMFENHGHVRHFFNEAYARECLQENFIIEKFECGEERFYDRPSAYIKVIAQKK